MNLFNCVCLILLVLEEYYCAPYLGWFGDEDTWNAPFDTNMLDVTDCGFGRHHHHERYSKTRDLFPNYSQYPQYPTSLTDYEKNDGKQYETPSYGATYNTPYGITQRTPKVSPTSIPQYGTMYGLTDSCWYDDGTPYKPDDITYHPTGIPYKQYGLQYNDYVVPYNPYGTPNNWYGTSYYPSGSPYSPYDTYNIYTPSGKINCSPYGRQVSFLGYPSSNPWGIPIPDISTKPLQKPKQDIPSESPNKTEDKSSKKTVDKPSNNILDNPIAIPTTPLIEPLIGSSSKALDDPSKQSLDKPSTISAEISSEILSDYSTVSPFDDLPTENLLDMNTVNPFDNAVDVSALETAQIIPDRY